MSDADNPLTMFDVDIEDDRPTTVPIAVHVPPEAAREALWAYQHREDQNGEEDMADQLLNFISLEPTFFVNGETVEEWMD